MLYHPDAPISHTATFKFNNGTTYSQKMVLHKPAVEVGSPLLIGGERQITTGNSMTIPFEVSALAQGEQIRLSVDARFAYSYGGCAPLMSVKVNQQDVTEFFESSQPTVVRTPLINKSRTFTFRNNMEINWLNESSGSPYWNVFYAPNFSEDIYTINSPLGVSETVEPFQFVWDITKLAILGSNSVTFTNMSNFPLVLRNPAVEIGEPWKRVVNGEKVQAAPNGVLPTYVAEDLSPPSTAITAMNVKMQNGLIQFTTGNRTFTVSTQTGQANIVSPNPTPVPTDWVAVSTGARGTQSTWSGSNYRVNRKVRLMPDHIEVADTFTNLNQSSGSDQPIGVTYKNSLILPDQPAEVLLGGQRIWGSTAVDENPAHPTALARWDGANPLTVGLVAEDDIFRIHNQEFLNSEAIGLADNKLGIVPGVSHTLEWSIYPRPGGNYWDFINAVRMNWGSNFPIIGPFFFDDEGAHLFRSTRLDSVMSQNEWNRTRSPQILSTGQGLFFIKEDKEADSLLRSENDYDGSPLYAKWPADRTILAGGTALNIPSAWAARAKQYALDNRAYNQANQIIPPIRSIAYLHPTFTTEPNAKTTYVDSKVLTLDNQHYKTKYGDLNTDGTIKVGYPIYNYLAIKGNSRFSPNSSSYGDALFATVKHLVDGGADSLGMDGIYLDEFTARVPKYVYQPVGFWDGCTVDIDPMTGGLLHPNKLPSSSVLLQQSWRQQLVDYLQDPKILIGNGVTHTRTMTQWKLQMFTEVNSGYWQLINTHLGCPWALGNNDADNTDQNFVRQTRRCLDYGGLFTPHSWKWPDRAVTPPHFTKLMYPTTPIQLREGMVLGRERIITNRSGRYGWPDQQASKIYIFNADGDDVASTSTQVSIQTVMVNGKTMYDLRMPSDHFAIIVASQI